MADYQLAFIERLSLFYYLWYELLNNLFLVFDTSKTSVKIVSKATISTVIPLLSHLLAMFIGVSYSCCNQCHHE